MLVVRFIFWAVSPRVYGVRARACPAALPRGRGGVSECVERVWDVRAGKRLQSKAHPGAPVVTGVRATTAMEGREVNARCSSEGAVGVPYDHVIALLV